MVGNNANGWDLLAHDYKSLEPKTRTLKKKGSKGLGLPANPWIRVRCECGYEISKLYPYPSIPLTGNTRCYPYPCHALAIRQSLQIFDGVTDQVPLIRGTIHVRLVTAHAHSVYARKR